MRTGGPSPLGVGWRFFLRTRGPRFLALGLDRFAYEAVVLVEQLEGQTLIGLDHAAVADDVCEDDDGQTSIFQILLFHAVPCFGPRGYERKSTFSSVGQGSRAPSVRAMGRTASSTLRAPALILRRCASNFEPYGDRHYAVRRTPVCMVSDELERHWRRFAVCTIQYW